MQSIRDKFALVSTIFFAPSIVFYIEMQLVNDVLKPN